MKGTYLSRDFRETAAHTGALPLCFRRFCQIHPKRFWPGGGLCPKRAADRQRRLACGYDGVSLSRHLHRIRLPGAVPLQRSYVTAVEIWLLKRMEAVYAHYPWKLLLKSGMEGVATSDYGRNLMREMMLVYDGDQKRYAQIAGHGFRILAEAMEKNLPYELKCPALLMCGTQDHAGSCIRYNKAWHRNAKIPLTWIEGAGHNSNTDKPEQVNRLIEEFVADIL